MACLVIVMHLVDLVWLVIPARPISASPRIPWGDLPLILAAMAGIGGIWAAAFLWQLKGATSRSRSMPPTVALTPSNPREDTDHGRHAATRRGQAPS